MPHFAEFFQESWLGGPFGIPDASRGGTVDNYIEITGIAPPTAAAFPSLRYRIIVGKKGAGKSHYLRVLQQALHTDDLYVLRQSDDLPTEMVIQITRLSRQYHSKLTENADIYLDPNFFVRDIWAVAWDRAILGSVFTVLFSPNCTSAEKKLRERLPSALDLKDQVEPLLSFIPGSNFPRSPISVLKTMNRRSSGKFQHFKDFLYDTRWDDIRRILYSTVQTVAPIVVLIDAVDDDFESAPEAWLYCQEGLFRSLVKFLNEATAFSNRIHVVAALREVVFSSLLRTEHANRYLTDSHILNLKWDHRSSTEFFCKKVEQIPKSLVANANVDVSRPLDRWLGISFIENISRERTETLIDYLLRHTRFLPRDIVILGNALTHVAKIIGIEDKETEIRKITHEVSKAIATEALHSSVNEALTSQEYVAELLQSQRPPLGIGAEGTGASAAAQVFRRMASDLREDLERKVTRFFQKLGHERFTVGELQRSLKESGLATADADDLRRSQMYRFDNILWRNGLIAVKDRASGTPWRFCTSGLVEELELPEDGIQFGLHSCLLDRFRFLKVSHNDPIF
jgi:hypothetical protein